jgi:hypothetical protein
MIDRKVGDKNIQFEMTIGKFEKRERGMTKLIEGLIAEKLSAYIRLVKYFLKVYN